MAVPDVKTNLQNTHVTAYVSAAGTSTGKKGVTISPVRGRITEVGFTFDSLCASAVTMQVDIGDQTSTTASTFTTVVTSTLGTFSSTQTFEGAICSVVPASNVYVQPGDIIRPTFSGGNAAAINATFYAVIRRG
ncbi:MAG: hypothetical protein ACM3IH_14100 [Sphingobacteriales bacterium]